MSKVYAVGSSGGATKDALTVPGGAAMEIDPSLGSAPYDLKIDTEPGLAIHAGKNWAESTLPSSAEWQSIAYGGGVFVSIVYYSNKAAYSMDGGKTWTESTMPISADWYSVTYGDGVFVAVASGSNKSAYSKDGGKTWDTGTMPSSAGWQTVSYGDGVFAATAAGNKSAYSTDGGKAWTASTLPSNATWQSVTYGDGVFVAVASGSNKSAYSTDGGKTWTASTMPSSESWTSAAYGDGAFVALAYNSNKSAYSTDGGKTWATSTMPSSERWQSVTYGDGVFVAVTYDSDKSAYSLKKELSLKVNGYQVGGGSMPGKSAYQYAVDGGFTGTEEEFQSLMAQAQNLDGGPFLPLSGGTVTGTLKVGTGNSTQNNGVIKLGIYNEDSTVPESEVSFSASEVAQEGTDSEGWNHFDSDIGIKLNGRFGCKGISAGGGKISSVASPEYNEDATNKQYVDTSIQQAILDSWAKAY